MRDESKYFQTWEESKNALSTPPVLGNPIQSNLAK